MVQSGKEKVHDLQDRSERIYIFVAIAYGCSIVVALAIFLDGGLFSSYRTKHTPLATGLLSLLMLAPAVANIPTRGITG